MKTGIELIAEERQALNIDEMSIQLSRIVSDAARKSLYVTDDNPNIITQLSISGALIAIEIDRLQNINKQP